ncbi:MAG: response regulator transcription factor [Gammaproteobacteria bacterium]|nr:response regulator transcription factor [Gammaproteobacteria bacterium]
MTTVGLIEDNIQYRNNLAFFLRHEGFEVVLESDGCEIDQQLTQHPCDLLVLDLGLGPIGEDGITIARRLRRQQPSMGIVMLTARGSIEDRLTGLDEGADAYVVKPVDFRELVAILRSLERRLSPQAIEQRQTTPGWNYRSLSKIIIAPDGQQLQLNPTEASLLEVLLAYTPNVAPKEAFATALEHKTIDFNYRWLELAISRLRKRLQTTDESEPLIRSARGRGYLFAAAITRSET